MCVEGFSVAAPQEANGLRVVPYSALQSRAKVKNAFSTLLDRIPALIVVKFENVSQKKESFHIFI